MALFAVWFSALLTLAIWSYLWKENPAYRLAEHLFIGASAGHALVMGVLRIRDLAWNPMLDPSTDGLQRFWAVFSMLLGLFLYARFVKGWRPVASLPIGILLGTGAGLSLGGTIISQGIAQITATILPLNSIDNIIIVLGVLVTMAYFIYTRATGATGKTVAYASTAGRYIMMIGFGAAYGNTVMGRIALLIGRVTFLLKDWLHIMS